jgi:hypothetical protein
MIQKDNILLARCVAAFREHLQFAPLLQLSVYPASLFHRLNAGAVRRGEAIQFIERLSVVAEVEPA